jgi:hypothetical protein
MPTLPVKEVVEFVLPMTILVAVDVPIQIVPALSITRPESLEIFVPVKVSEAKAIDAAAKRRKAGTSDKKHTTNLQRRSV